ncbi:NtaA/DmoA family FMN-dependent monooxygenase [Nocardia sp. NPDC060249]|uniref:NtaA/DmoA family FMN-dependent monooxygenase n=1 Tax=Nocardia sp. NPDC060249 TaxID=3347082 RepID=UPI003667C8E1
MRSVGSPPRSRRFWPPEAPMGARSSARKDMVLCAFLCSTGYHSASWRRPGADPMANIKPDYFCALARTAERGDLDAVFLADSMAVWSDVAVRPAGAVEPAVLAAAILQATERIGVIITQSTSYNEPFNVARRLASLDHLGNGRIGWNIVTSATREAAQNFGLADIPDHDTRYRRANEFVRVCLALWNSWQPDAIRADPNGIWADPAAITPIEHDGAFFRVRGPLDVPPSPQRVPLLVQAGSSEQGIALASEFADLVFSVASTVEAAYAFRQRLLSRARAADPRRRIRVLPGLIPVVGSTDEDAHQRLAALDALVDPAPSVRQLERSLAIPPNTLAVDDPFDLELPSAAVNSGNQTYYQVIRDMALARCYTVGQVARLLATSRGHRLVIGSPTTVATAMIDWVRRGAADGYVVMPAALPSDLNRFVDEVVPLVRSAGYHGMATSEKPLAQRFRTDRTPR